MGVRCTDRIRAAEAGRPASAARVAIIGLALVGLTRVDGAQPPPPPPSESTTIAADDARRVRQRVDALQREADALAAQERTLIGDLRRLEIARDLQAAQAADAATRAAQTAADLDGVTRRLATIERQVTEGVPGLSQRLAALYRLGRPGYLRLITDVDDARALARTYRLAASLNAIDRRRADGHVRALTDLRRTREALAARQAQQARERIEADAARDRATAAAARVATLVRDITTRRDLNARYRDELRAAHARLQATMAELAAGGRAPDAAALPIGPFRGDLDWPVAGSVLVPYGRVRNPRFHTALVSNGVVIAAAADTPVRAVHQGVVAYAQPFTGFGNVVIVDHGRGAFTMYGHLSMTSAPVGTRVARGQTVGTVGLLVDGPSALYFELRIDGKPVDPLQWLRTR